MKTHTMFYLSPKNDIRGHWHAGGHPGWPDAGGWLSFGDPRTDVEQVTSLTVYLDEAQLLRLQDVVNRLVDGRATAGGPLSDDIVVSSASD